MQILQRSLLWEKLFKSQSSLIQMHEVLLTVYRKKQINKWYFSPTAPNILILGL